MLEFVKRKYFEWRRRRTLVVIRRKFAECGHPLDDLDDFNIETALRLNDSRIEPAQLTSKSIYFTLRRLSEQRKTRVEENKLKAAN